MLAMEGGTSRCRFAGAGKAGPSREQKQLDGQQWGGHFKKWPPFFVRKTDDLRG